MEVLLLQFILYAVIAFMANFRPSAASISSDTLVDFKSERVHSAIEGLVKAGQFCTISVRATPEDVRAYFTNQPSKTPSGRCFVACMLESSGVYKDEQINPDVLVELAGLVNGPNSRVVHKLSTVSIKCLNRVQGFRGRCLVASVYNDCLNEHMSEFSFPIDVAEAAVVRMPYNLVQPSMPVELGHHMILYDGKLDI